MVLLHEIAHWLRPSIESHSKEFWKLAFKFYKQYGVPIRKAYQREKSYKKGAEVGYRDVQGLKPVKRKQIKTLKAWRKGRMAPIGIRIDVIRNQAWAITELIDNGKWRGYKISKRIYKLLLKEGYKKI